MSAKRAADTGSATQAQPLDKKGKADSTPTALCHDRAAPDFPLFEIYLQDIYTAATNAIQRSNQDAFKKPSKAIQLYQNLIKFTEAYRAKLLAICYESPLKHSIGPLTLLKGKPLSTIITERDSFATAQARKLLGIFNEWQPHVAKDAATSKAHQAMLTELHRRAKLNLWLSMHVKLHSEHGVRITAISEGDLDDSGLERDDIIEALVAHFAAGRLSFPWKKLYLSNANAQAMMAQLKQYKPQWDKSECQPHNIRFFARNSRGEQLFPLSFQGGYLGLRHAEEDYNTMDVLVDIFQERARLNAKRTDQDASPLAQWAQPEFIEANLKQAIDKFGKWSPFTLREVFYGQVRECTQFKPSLAVAIIRFFKSRRMLDISAGWGDRLAGAIACGLERYQAFDPNTSLRDGHTAIIRAFVPAEQQQKFTVTYTGFEHAQLRPNSYDLVFTSPPFFDFEIYTQLPGQSVDTYKSLDSWLVRFLFASLRRAWAALTPNGHMVIHLTDVYKTKVCEKMCLMLQWQLPDFEYVGVICSFGAAKRGRPIWVFRKLAAANANFTDRSAIAEHELKRTAMSTWQEAESFLTTRPK
eukprot:TRINITY_DN9675_c0_g1_i3.p1 TRINITY_DN9675_c0_g1~~TRINITY_DN9675_c0_g1_i3.p1  ORF type:complete len:583 (+),score=94.02 TRINITY_DN9675_c0_g1_i3:1344-3092(+)